MNGLGGVWSVGEHPSMSDPDKDTEAIQNNTLNKYIYSLKQITQLNSTMLN